MGRCSCCGLLYNYCLRTIITRSWLETALEYQPYMKTEFSEKNSFKRNKWSSKMGWKVYKPRLITARARYICFWLMWDKNSISQLTLMQPSICSLTICQLLVSSWLLTSFDQSRKGQLGSNLSLELLLCPRTYDSLSVQLLQHKKWFIVPFNIV